MSKTNDLPSIDQAELDEGMGGEGDRLNTSGSHDNIGVTTSDGTPIGIPIETYHARTDPAYALDKISQSPNMTVERYLQLLNYKPTASR